MLVRTKGKWAGGGDRSWLLIKHRDDWAGEVDIAEFAPLSVKSKGDFADILAEGQPRHLDLASTGAGRRGRRDVREDHRAGSRDAGIGRVKGCERVQQVRRVRKVRRVRRVRRCEAVRRVRCEADEAEEPKAVDDSRKLRTREPLIRTY